MDTTRDIIYRSFYLNDSTVEDNIVGGGAAGSGISGCVVDTFDLTDVDVVQWSEKRSQGDGSDAGDVYLGQRRLRMTGTLYGLTRNTLFDSLFDLRAALNPVLAQREEPLDKGYRPLYFSVPTNRLSDYPGGVIELMVYALPRGLQHVTHDSDIGGDDDDALAIQWQATMICKDPGIYSADPVDVNFDTYETPVTDATGQNAGDTITKAAHGLADNDRVTFYTLTGGTGLSTGVTYYVVNKTTDTFQVSLTQGGAAVAVTSDYSVVAYVKSTSFTHSIGVDATWDNRGTYLAGWNCLAVVGAGAGTIEVTVGDSSFTVTVPASAAQRIIRIKEDKIITVEEASVETPQMSYITFNGATTWPLIESGDTPYTITFHGFAGLAAGGHMWFYEKYA